MKIYTGEGANESMTQMKIFVQSVLLVKFVGLIIIL